MEILNCPFCNGEVEISDYELSNWDSKTFECNHCNNVFWVEAEFYTVKPSE